MKAIFFGDAHIDRKRDRLKNIERFLDSKCKDVDFLFIMGDLFEFFYGNAGFESLFPDLLEKLREFAFKGKTIYLLEGNHEFYVEGERQGIIFRKELEINIDGKRIFLAHGDRITSPILKRILSSFFVKKIVRLFGPKFSYNLAMLLKPIFSGKKEPDERTCKKLLKFAKKKLEEGCDVVIFAHSHKAERKEFEGSKLYLNTGDFIRSFDYVEYETNKGFEVKRFQG